jgi:glycosyltransferase involved in cell wall biosynthesis
MWTVAQIGAREHFFPARSFQARGWLERLYTDLWCRWGRSLLRRGPSALRALAGRYHSDIPSNRVVSFNSASMMDRFFRHDRQPERFYDECLRIGIGFDESMLRQLERQQFDSKSDAFFTYNTGCLKSLRSLRDRGVFTVVDQVDPARTEYEVARAEIAKWPGWDTGIQAIPDSYFERMSAEWEAASAVLVNSNWSAKALQSQSVPREKIMIVPLFFDPSSIPQVERHPKKGTLVILWLGLVVLRKGIQYLIEAARLLQGRDLRFDIVGPIIISEQATRSAPPNVRFLGRYSREQTAVAYEDADVFVLPTLSDGFAITQLEAMAYGLPVVATPNCGDVVDHDVNGLIVPAGDSQALAAALARLDDDRQLVAAMSVKAWEKSRRFSLTEFADRLESEFHERHSRVR